MKLHSYVVRYDSGFAPNPFYEMCTLATCKPGIRQTAAIGDWIVGSGSGDRAVKRAGYLVYAMRVTEALTFQQYATDPRFEKKKPFRYGSRRQSCGDNIYFPNALNGGWSQRDSFHSNVDGTANPAHIARDTGVNRVLVSDDFVYFGGYGPSIPSALRDSKGKHVCKIGIGRTIFDEQPLIAQFEHWIRSLGSGYQDAPFEWKKLRG
jgi:nucleoside-diphosphate-sugar epimerase